ncbi:hypothetical protein GCM10022206_08520 [Streptomyces chiangmaiensis]
MFSQPPAIPGAYGPQGMYSYRPAVWERLLTRAGFSTAQAEVIEAPKADHIGTLIVSARA